MGITIFIIIFTVLVSIGAMRNRELNDKLKLNPYMVIQKKQYYRVVSHALIHANWEHLIFNMLTLWFFGDSVEAYIVNQFVYGKIIFIVFYFVAAIVATAPALINHRNHHWYNSLGASGAVSAILFMSILIDPKSSLMIIPIPIPIPGYLFGIGYLIYSHYMSRKKADNIDHTAHLAGAIFGFVFPILVKPELFQLFFNKILA